MNSTVASYFQQFDLYQKVVDASSNAVGFDTSTILAFAVILLFAALFTTICATVGGFGTYAERKISADIQARVGPNRVGPYGLLQVLADGVKMIMKEDVMPNGADKLLFYLAPFLAIFGVFSTIAVLPFSSGFTLSNFNIGIFYLVAISSLVGVAVFLGGYAANSKWSLLGGMRGASQIISYEIPVTISILSISLIAGSLSFEKVVEMQSGLPHNWFIFHNPFTFVAFFAFFVAGLAETNRAPFDLPEAESELVSGYHTEYTGMRFGLFALAEYVEIFVIAGVTVTLFLGGYNLPFKLGADSFWVQPLQIGVFIIKTLALYYVVIWVRWTFPRLRVDHLMVICWKYLTPIAIFNLVGIAIWMVVFDGTSMWDLLFK